MTLLAIGLMTAVIYALRMSGFVLAGATLPSGVDRALRFTPIATLAAVTVAVVSRGGATSPVELTALAAGALSAWITRQLWVCVTVGVATAVALNAVSG